ncbi:MAG: sulfur oxidation c-type cytochrome SoxX [Pseudomonadota bacterium]
MSIARWGQQSLAALAIAVPLCASANVDSAAVAAAVAEGVVEADPAAAERGRALFAESTDAQCILCHRHDRAAAPFPGTLGPDLTHVAQRRTRAELRELIEDPTRSNPATAMPAYFRRTGLQQVQARYRDQTILSAAQIDDLLAFLTAP